MNYWAISLGISVIVNLLLIWYLIILLRKFFFVSNALADLFLTFKAFEAFLENLYGMEMFYGEPVIQDLIEKTKDVLREVEIFRDVFEYTLDAELEEELNEPYAEQAPTQKIEV